MGVNIGKSLIIKDIRLDIATRGGAQQRQAIHESEWLFSLEKLGREVYPVFSTGSPRRVNLIRIEKFGLMKIEYKNATQFE